MGKEGAKYDDLNMSHLPRHMGVSGTPKRGKWDAHKTHENICVRATQMHNGALLNSKSLT